ncbi:hypothetical protein BGE01nite_13580 [Brevifollis gellanilyticus]|uniref:Ig-like domain-containing protein n=2 Tax=Brevifollis gellanilyticus TaxID=748831 RepID=A0A512M5R0_9BACT|nr:hypothetical protein BGE01nite_13580 [Brevifollis gellanilyticus]
MGYAVVGGSVNRPITIRNTGEETLSALSFSMVGGNSSDFITGGLTESTIAAGASKTLTVSFSPSEGGLRATSLHIGSNDPGQNPFVVSLSGTAGTAPSMITDNFDDNLIDAAKWSLEASSVQLVETDQRLSFVGASEEGAESRLSLLSGQPTYGQDWEATVEATNSGKSLVVNSRVRVSLEISGDSGNHITLPFQWYFPQPPAKPSKIFIGEFVTDNVASVGLTEQFNATSPNSVLKVSFNATSKVFTLSVDLDGATNGYQWQALSSYGVAGGGGAHNANWGMSADDKFGIALVGFMKAAGPGYGTLSFDNFSLKASSIVPPVITKHPSSQLRVIGQRATMVTTATGSPLNYQWYMGESGDTTTPIEGATSASYTTPYLSGGASFWVQVSNSLGAVNSNTAVIATTETPQAPEFVEQAQSVVATLGQIVTFSPGVTGSDPITLLWKRGTTSIPGGTASSLTIGPLKTTDAGIYTLTAKSDVSTEVSDNVYLAVVTPGPATRSVPLGGNVTMTANVAFPAGTPMSYRWKQGTTLLDDGDARTGTHDKTLVITGMTGGHAGEYTCEITMHTPHNDVVGNNGPTVLAVVQKPTLNAEHLSEAFDTVQVAQSVNFVIPASNNPTKFTVSGLPAGIKLDAATGRLTGQATAAKLVRGEVVAYLLKVSASNAAGSSEIQTVEWKVMPLGAAETGNFYGLINRDQVLTDELGGTLKVTVLSTGAFTGTVKLASKTYAFKGTLTKDNDEAPFIVHASISRKTGQALLYLDFTVGTQAYEDENLEETLAVVGNDEEGEATLTVFHSPWSAKAPATQYVGSYNTAFDPQGGDGPAGFGVAVVNVTAAGIVSWSGKLADATVFTGSAPLGKGGQVAMHNMLYVNTGCVQGTSLITAGEYESLGEPVPKLLDGSVYWVKNEQPQLSTTRTYKLGFMLNDVKVIGGLYAKPGLNKPVLGLLTDALPNANASLTFAETQGHISGLEMWNVAINDKNAVTVETPNDFGIKLTVAAKTGNFSGSFVLKDPDPTSDAETPPTITRSVTYTGILITREGFNRGVGFFNVAELPFINGEVEPAKKVTVTPQWSGSVTLE